MQIVFIRGEGYKRHPVVIALRIQQLLADIQQLGLHTGKARVTVCLHVAHRSHGTRVVHHKDKVHALLLVIVELELHLCLGLVLILPAGRLADLGIASAGAVVFAQMAALPIAGLCHRIQNGSFLQVKLAGQNGLHPLNQGREFYKDIAVTQLGRLRNGQVLHLIAVLERKVSHIGAAVGNDDLPAQIDTILKGRRANGANG